jgi:hypothetical protein
MCGVVFLELTAREASNAHLCLPAQRGLWQSGFRNKCLDFANGSVAVGTKLKIYIAPQAMSINRRRKKKR